MGHIRGTLAWWDLDKAQVRGVLMRNGIASNLWSDAHKRFMAETWAYGPSLYLIDTLTNKGARVTIQGPEEFDVKVSSRTGEALLAEIIETMPALADHIVIID